MKKEPLPLPVVLQEQEISEQDFETLIRIAEDPQAPSGRLNRVPKRIPVQNREAVHG